MSKGIPKFRYVDYTDDGCTIFQCLFCKARWECRNFGTNFCGFCGCKWDGELEWDQDAKDRRKHGVKPSPNAAPKPPEKCWVIERMIEEKDGVVYKDWATCQDYSCYLRWPEIERTHIAHRIADDLRKFRTYESLRVRTGWGLLKYHYRAVLGTEIPAGEYESVPNDYQIKELQKEVAEDEAREAGERASDMLERDGGLAGPPAEQLRQH